MRFTVEFFAIIIAIVAIVGLRMGWRAPHTLSMLVNATVAAGLFVVVFMGLLRPPELVVTIVFSIAYLVGGIVGRLGHNFWSSRPKREEKPKEDKKEKKDKKDKKDDKKKPEKA
jgi:amino acid transporter